MLKFATIPQKRLLQGISSSATSFYLDNILSFDGLTDIVPADLGSVHYCAFRNDTGTVLELMEIDPATISSGPITINKRGLSFYGDLTTQDTDLKLDWPANTIVMLGTDVPQIFQWLKEYVDDTAFNGAPDASTTVKGIVEEATDAEIVAGTDTGATGAKLFAPPSKMNTQIQAKIVTDRVRTTTATSSATPTIDTDTYNRLTLTAQAVDITSMTTNLSGTPVDGQKLQVRITTPSTSLAFINSSSNAGTTATLAPSKPTNTADNDIMFCIAHCYGGTVTTLAGWTLIGTQAMPLNGSNSYLFYRVASSEGSSYTWTFSNTALNQIAITTYRGGFNPSNAISVYSNTAYTVNNSSLRAAYINIPYINSPVLFFGNSEDTYNLTPPTLPTTTTWTEDLDNGRFAVSTTYTSRGDFAESFKDYISGNMSGSSQQKAAWLVALNPTIGVTWGASFTSNGDTLPSALQFNKDHEFNFSYNSTLSKWEYMDEIRDTINSGIESKDISSTTTTTIPHYLGSRPKKVKLLGNLATSTITCLSNAWYTTSQIAVSLFSQTGTGTDEVSETFFRLRTSTADYLQGIITTDATNVTITWSKTGTPTGTAYLMWEAEI